jgi:hypothetical protein
MRQWVDLVDAWKKGDSNSVAIRPDAAASWYGGKRLIEYGVVSDINWECVAKLEKLNHDRLASRPTL